MIKEIQFNFKVNWFSIIILFSITGCNALETTVKNSSSDSNSYTISEGLEYHNTFYLSGATNMIIQNCTFSNISGHGVVIRNSRNVIIRNCIVCNISGMGILLPEDSSNENITVANCTIYNIGVHGVHVTQRELQKLNNRNFKLLNSLISNTGMAKQWPGHDHGVYIQSGGFLIDGNTVHNAMSGHAISVRSTGIISRNICYNNSGSGIDYFNDHQAGADDTLIIENNICWDDDQTNMNGRHLIQLVYDPLNPGFLASNYIIRFNTMVSFQTDMMCISGDSQFLNKNLSIYGNLAVNITNGPIFPLNSLKNSNYTTNTLSGFVNSFILPYDFHLTKSHPARNTAGSFSNFPTNDLDNDPRFAGFLDSGADQFISNPVE